MDNIRKCSRLTRFLSQADQERFRKNYEFQGGPSTEKPAPVVFNKISYTPSEEDEQLRWTGSHFAAKELFGSNVQPQVANYLSFKKGVHCLHIGCGAGAFLMDMASEYPKSTFVGADTVPMAEIVCGIPNISFVLGNVLDGLSLAENSFDYIQMRVLGNLLTRDQWPVVLKEVYRLLKPGGCVGFFEYEPRETGNNDCARVFTAVKTLMESLNQEPLSGQKLKTWVVDAGLEHVASDETNIDCGPDTGRAKRWRWFWKELCLFVGPYLSPILKVKIEDWPDFVNDHIKDMNKHHGHITIIRSLARKPLE
ncbi:S-adenosyl-L-methionine-dependent methyltransferase [Pilaira anomala]|nr:S-adenosyl-L-methionine-dependent methyltransferase [Pilaira anomala]